MKKKLIPKDLDNPKNRNLSGKPASIISITEGIRLVEEANRKKLLKELLRVSKSF